MAYSLSAGSAHRRLAGWVASSRRLGASLTSYSSRRFSSRRRLSSCASEASMPPYLLRKRQNVVCVTACSRRRSVTGRPASACSKIPMICGSADRLFRAVSSVALLTSRELLPSAHDRQTISTYASLCTAVAE